MPPTISAPLLTLLPALLPIEALLIGVALQLVLARALSARSKGWLAFATGLVALAGVLANWPRTMSGQAIDFQLLRWDGPISLAYHVDGLSQLFALMATGIGAAVLIYSVGYMAHDPAATRFYALIQLFIAGLVHLVYTSDLILLYLSWEIIGLCSFLLVGFWYQQREAARGARKVLVMTHAAGYGLLTAILLIYARTGSTLWTDPKVATAFTDGIFLLMLVAAVAKSVQFPLHTWIPDAMAAPTPVSALLHAACYVKAGVYLIARMHSLGQWPITWQYTVTWIGAITLLIGVLWALAQHDLKRLLAFHTVSQIGYMLLGIGLSTPLGIAAGLLHCFNHGLFKGGLFLCAGAVQHATGTRDMDRLGGLIRRMPRLGALWVVVAAGIAGVPLFNGFVSKWLVYNAALNAGQPVPALIAWFGSILTVFSFLKATSGVFLGQDGVDSARAEEAPKTMLIGIAVLAFGCIVLGVAPQVGITYLINPLLPALGMPPLAGVSWLGLSVGAGSWYATGGLILALVATAVGVGVFALGRSATPTVSAVGAGPVSAPEMARYGARGQAPRLQDASSVAVSPFAAAKGVGGLGAASLVFSGGEPLPASARLAASDFSFIVKSSLAPFYRWTNVDALYLSAWRWLLEIADTLARAADWLESRAVQSLVVGALLLAALGAAVTPNVGPALATGATIVPGTVLRAVALAFAALLLTTYAVPRTQPALPLLALAGLLALGGLAVELPLIRLGLLEIAAFAALALIWQLSGSAGGTRRAYLAAVVLSAVGLGGGTLALSGGAPGLALALILAGVAVKLALVPAYVWLPKVAASIPAPVVGLVVAIVDVAAFGEVVTLRAEAPWLFAASAPWLALGVLSALGGALLMLAQRDIKRLLAFSTIEDMGILVIGVALGGELGLGGATIGVTAHALAKALLFASLAFIELNEANKVNETNEAPSLDSRGLATRYPLASAAFLVGSLGVLGIPPTLGFVGHWRLFAAVAGFSPALLAVAALATILALFAYARVIAVCWWGPGEGEKQREPLVQSVALVVLAAVLVAAGVWPAQLGGWLLG